jgi:hypothetical protein
MSRNAPFVVVLVGLGLLTGCTTSATGRSVSQERKDALKEFGELLKALSDEGTKPPAKLAALEPVEPRIPTAGPAIRNGDIIYLWGAEYVAGGTKVVAYEKQTPGEGGLVLLQDGTVKEMSAADFGSAAKAK